MPDLHLGVAVGATDTQAVLIDSRDRLVAKVKAPTAAAIRESLQDAVGAVLAARPVNRANVRWVMLGAAHVMKRALQGPGLPCVATVRLGAPLTLAVPPLATWPAPLRSVVSCGETVVQGGAEYDGRHPAPLDEDALARFLASVAENIGAVAITGVFAPVTPDHELAAAAVVRRELGGDVHVSLSHEIGSVGLIERENATVLNAALVGPALALANDLVAVLGRAGLDGEVFFAQNDGTVMALERALHFPVLMIDSAGATTLRGAAHLSGATDAVVADVGASTTDLGVLVSGSPRESTRPTRIVGVRMSLRAAQIDRLECGGDTSSRAGEFAAQLAAGIERAKPSRATAPLVVVGRGAGLVPARLAGVSQVIRPPDHDVAHAVGAATAHISAHAERICPDRPDLRAAVLAEARRTALAEAVGGGADPGAVAIVEAEQVPITQLVPPAIRVRVKASGPRGSPTAAPASA